MELQRKVAQKHSFSLMTLDALLPNNLKDRQIWKGTVPKRNRPIIAAHWIYEYIYIYMYNYIRSKYVYIYIYMYTYLRKTHRVKSALLNPRNVFPNAIPPRWLRT